MRAGLTASRLARCAVALVSAVVAAVGCAKEVVPIPAVKAPPVARPAPPPPMPPPPPAKPPAPAEPPMALAPIFHVGEEWRWVEGGVTRIVAVEGGLHVTEDRQGRRLAYDPTWTLVKVMDRRGTPIDDPQVGRKVLAFPLSVGKVWAWRGVLPAARGSGPRPYIDRYRVTSYEEVRVKAGAFRAFVIEHVQEVPAQAGAPAGESRRILWYSPEAKVFVKVESSSPGWGGGELESYTLKP